MTQSAARVQLIRYKARKMPSENRKLSPGAKLTRKFIFFTQHLGRVQLTRYKGRSGYSQNREFDAESSDSRRIHLFDTIRSPCSIRVTASTMVPCLHDSLTPQVDGIDPPSSCRIHQDTKPVKYNLKGSRVETEEFPLYSLFIL